LLALAGPVGLWRPTSPSTRVWALLWGAELPW